MFILRNRIKFLFYIFFISILFIGCSNHQIDSTQILTTEEDESYTTSFYCSNEETEFDGKCYDSDLVNLSKEVNANYLISMVYGNEIIEEVEEIVDYLLLNNIVENKELTFNIMPDNENRFDYLSHIVYVNSDDIQSFELVFQTILGVFDSKANYGLIYGLAYNIAVDLGYITYPVINTTDYLTLFAEENHYLLDMTYPCFLEEYTTSNAISQVKRFASGFVNLIIEQHGIDELLELINLTEISQYAVQYNKYLNEYLDFMLSDLVLMPNEHTIVFDRFPGIYRLIWSTESSDWYLHDSYENTNVLFTEDFSFSNYKELRETLIIFEEEMDRIDSLFKNEDTDYPRLKIYLSEIDSQNSLLYNPGGYFDGDDEIYLENILLLSHEYIHYITMHYMEIFEYSRWFSECIAHYYSLDFHYYDIYMNYFFFGEHDYGEGEMIIDEVLNMYSNYYGREATPTDDINELIEIYVHVIGRYDDVFQQYNEYSSPEYIAFIMYFIETYGEDTLIYLIPEMTKVYDVLDITWIEIVNEWKMYLNAKY